MGFGGGRGAAAAPFQRVTAARQTPGQAAVETRPGKEPRTGHAKGREEAGKAGRSFSVSPAVHLHGRPPALSPSCARLLSPPQRPPPPARPPPSAFLLHPTPPAQSFLLIYLRHLQTSSAGPSPPGSFPFPHAQRRSFILPLPHSPTSSWGAEPPRTRAFHTPSLKLQQPLVRSPELQSGEWDPDSAELPLASGNPKKAPAWLEVETEGWVPTLCQGAGGRRPRHFKAEARMQHEI
ncbi:forkhead box protein L2-like [Candoia aspera]|uniref:forkhead box protein L2-like n=1 Tax=Candoia aspera TaxID=51853 RepID=UPI002FD8585C